MSKYGDIIKKISELESSGKEVQTKDILSEIGKYENEKTISKVETRISQPSEEIPAGYADALKRLKEAQAKLTPVLVKKHPEAKPIYDNITQQGVERMETFKQKMPNYYLTPEEQKSILGDQYGQFQLDLRLVSGHLSKLYPEMAEIRGTEEQEGDELNYGLRSASLGQYTGGERNVVSDIKKYSTMTGVPKVEYGQ